MLSETRCAPASNLRRAFREKAVTDKDQDRIAEKIAAILEKSKDEPGLNEIMALLALSREATDVTVQIAANQPLPAIGQYAHNNY